MFRSKLKLKQKVKNYERELEEKMKNLSKKIGKFTRQDYRFIISKKIQSL